MRARPGLAVAIASAFGVASTVLAHEGLLSEYNFRDDVRPIFVEHCASCHRPGGVGPMSLLSYSDAAPWANAVKMQVLNNQMPPWLPDEGVGAFEHARSLSAAEVDVLIDWIIGQTPEGEPMSAAETAIDPPPEWRMGAPDLVLIPETDVVIGEDDDELTHCLVLPTRTSEPHVASELELKPGLPTIVRRATIYLGDGCEGSRPVATWIPGQASVMPAHRGYEIPAGASLAVAIVYVKGWEDEGKRLTDRSELGIRFADAGQVVSSYRMAERAHTFPDGVDIVAVFPDAGPEAENAPLTLELVHPGGEPEPILVIEDFHSAWSEKYVLSEPLSLPPGTELRLSEPAVWIDFIPHASASAE